MHKRVPVELKEKILNTAIKVFSEKGYSKTTIREIANRAGISIGGIYIYFKNKEEIYLTLLKNLMDDLTYSLKNNLEDIQDPVIAIRTFMAINLNYMRKHKSLILIEGKEQGFKFSTNIMKKRFLKVQSSIITNIIRKGINSGKFKACNVNEISKVIISVLRGFGLSMVVDSKALFSSEVCCSLVLNGLLKGGLKNEEKIVF